MAKSSLIGALRVTLGMDTAKFEERAGAMERRMKGMQKNFAKVAKGFAAAGVAAAGALSVAIKKNIDAMDSLTKMSQQLGIPVDQLRQLQYVADLSGVSIDSLANAFKRASKNMSDISLGAGAEAKRAFDQLGISATGADGNLKTTQQVMTEVANRFVGMEDGAQKTAIAMGIFGKSGADLIPLLNGGGQAIHDMMVEADELGLTFDQKAGQAAERFNDNITRIQGALQGVANKATQSLLPTLDRLSAALVDFVKNGDKVTSAASAIVGVFQGIAYAANLTVNTVRTLGAAFVYLKNVASAPFNDATIKGVTQEYLSALDSIRSEFQGINEVIYGPKPDEIVKANGATAGARWAAGFGEGAQGGLDKTAAALAGVRAKGLIKPGFTPEKPPKPPGRGGDNLAQQGQSIFDATRTALEKYNLEIERLNMLLQKGVIDQDTFNRALDQAKETLKGAEKEISPIGQTLQSSFSGMFDSIIDGTFKAGDAFKSLAKTILKQFANKAIANIFSNLFDGAGAGAGGGFGKLFAGFFDNGGLIPQGKVGMVGEYGAEMVKGPATVVSRKDTSKLMGGGGQSQNIVVNAPGATAETVNNIKQAVADLNKNFDRRAVGAVMQRQMRGV
jgi:ribosomal protein L12E/L44/L45/RPP1/RPP2